MSTSTTDQPGEVVRWRTVSWDVIELPTDRLKERLPVDRIARDQPALPGREFTLHFRYNDTAGYWVWWVDLDGEGEIIPRQPVHYGDAYDYGNYLVFNFIDFSRETREVTPDTLGDDVELIATPKPDSPGFDDWLARQEILERELPQVGAL